MTENDLKQLRDYGAQFAGDDLPAAEIDDIADRLIVVQAELIKRLEAERDVYREFFNLAFELDFTSNMTDSTEYHEDDIASWADMCELVERLKTMRGETP